MPAKTKIYQLQQIDKLFTPDEIETLQHQEFILTYHHHHHRPLQIFLVKQYKAPLHHVEQFSSELIFIFYL